MRKVCIDTDIMGWYAKGEATEGQEGNIEKARWLFEWFEKEGIRAVIPSIVVGELLSNVMDESRREEISDFINDNFDVLQYDIISARIFADIQASKAEQKASLREHREAHSVPACKMKNDWNIASIALSNNCDAIFSNNKKDFEAFVGTDKIPVFDLTFVDSKKQEIAEIERLEKEAKEAQAAKLKEVQEGELLPQDLSAFETAEQARIRREKLKDQAKQVIDQRNEGEEEE